MPMMRLAPVQPRPKSLNKHPHATGGTEEIGWKFIARSSGSTVLTFAFGHQDREPPERVAHVIVEIVAAQSTLGRISALK